MINLEKAITLEKYINNLEGEQTSNYENISLNEKSKAILKELSSTINIWAFTEGYCPDCTVAIPFLRAFEKECSHINVKVLPRSGNENFLQENLGEARIPTIMVFDSNMEPKGVFLEHPEGLKEKIALLPMAEKKQLIEEYRKGSFNDLLQEELINIILK